MVWIRFRVRVRGKDRVKVGIVFMVGVWLYLSIQWMVMDGNFSILFIYILHICTSSACPIEYPLLSVRMITYISKDIFYSCAVTMQGMTTTPVYNGCNTSLQWQ